MKKVAVATVLVFAVLSFTSGHARGNPAALNHYGNSTMATLPQQCSTLTFLTESLPDFHLGRFTNFQIQAIGGTPPYTFVITGGALPPLLFLTPNGRIIGLPLVVTDTTIFVKLTDSAGCMLTQAFAVRVVSP
jgi:hypothetical protein